MKKLIICLAAALPFIGFSQDSDTESKSTFNQFLDNLSGSFESKMQWYNDDKTLGDFSEDLKDIFGEHHVRANSYLRLDYNFLKNFSVGVQVESYAPMSTLNYSNEYDDTNIAQYYAMYRNKNLEVTAGSFYEQFGSGLLLRAFEERQLGINTSLQGGRIKYSPIPAINMTALYGKQRIGLDEFPKQKMSKGSVFGFDTELDLADIFKLESMSGLSLGASYVGKQEDYTPEDEDFDTTDFPELINSFSVRLDADFGKFFTNIEYNIKGEDIGIKPQGAFGAGDPIEGKYYDGNALLFTTGYSKKGFGISNTFRRIENIAFFSEFNRYSPKDNIFNLASMNYIPALTKQQDYSLANIYVYNAQGSLNFERGGPTSGEIGTQLDVFYKIKKGTLLGGKYGTKVSGNFSYWAILDTEFDFAELEYKTEFLGFKNKVYRDFNFDVRKKWSPSFSSIFTYINVEINHGIALSGPVNLEEELIKSNIAIVEGTYKFKNKQSARLELQHLWTKDDDKNWAGGTFEYNLNRKVSVYATDMWNYGGGFEDNLTSSATAKAEHYYSLGGSYTKGATRVALNYGRQRGGLFCVGGVCRQVSPNTGVTIELSTSF